MASQQDNVTQIFREEDRKQKRDNAPDHVELRDRWLELNPDMAFGGGEWMAYGAGYWSPVEDVAVEGQIMDVLEAAIPEGTKPTQSVLSSVLRLARAKVHVPKERWRADAGVMVLANGTLEVDSRTFREHRLDDYALHSLPYEYDPDADCPIFKAILAQIGEDKVEMFQDYAGYCLTHDTSHETALWLKGPRGCGKSTVIEAFSAMLGSLSGVLGLGEIEMSRFALGRIPGKTLLTSTEQPASYLKSTHVIDALISGETLTIERKNKDAEEIAPTAKLIWAMNDEPRISNTTSGIFRRVKVVPFHSLQGEPDPALKFMVRDEAPGILNWALEGLERLEERGHFVWPQSVRDATSAFQESNDLPAQFVDQMCRVGEGYYSNSRYFYEKYKDWCLEGGHKPASITRVAEDWRRLGFSIERTRSGSVVKGIKYVGEGDDGL